MMRSITTTLMLLTGALAIVSTGCAGGLETRTFQSRLIEDAQPEQVFAAAEVIMRREFGRVELDPERQRISSQPVEYVATNDSGTFRDLRGGESRLRRIANLQLADRRTGTLVRLRIEIEREDTEYHEQFQPRQDRLHDTPGRTTAIERDAATSARQNTVWTFVRRDQRLERALLGELEELFAPLPQPEPDAPAVVPAGSAAP